MRHAPAAAGIPAASLALCAAATGCALQVNFGQYHPVALAWLTVAVGGVALCVAKPRLRFIRALEARGSYVFALALATQFALLMLRSPGAISEASLTPFRVGAATAAALCGVGLVAHGRWRLAALGTVLLVHALLGLWVLRSSPQPGVDVCLFQRDAAAALLQGQNPYAITFRDPYADSTRFYGPGVSVGGRLQFGYPYPPLILLLVAPAHWLGDFRYAQWAAMTLAGAFVALARPGRIGFAAAMLLLFTPRGFFVLEAGWTEPFAVLFLAATVFAACRSPRQLPVPLGLFLASKQYLVLALFATPLLPFRRERDRLASLLKAAMVVGIVTLPLALWDVTAFVHSAVLLQFHQPFRDDALSYLVPLKQALGVQAPAWVAFALAGAAVLLAVRKAPRTPAGFATAVAAVLLAFFAFNKQAFCNYYHLVIGALCCAAGATPALPRTRPPDGAETT